MTGGQIGVTPPQMYLKDSFKGGKTANIKLIVHS